MEVQSQSCNMQIVLLRGGMRGGLYLYLYIDLQLESSVTVASGTSPATRLLIKG